uniref:Peptidase A1 domain-containing protein n=1 Tax=Araucaria cunninghamii TaxID=56994 RepID=A0A0D6R307_ARACU
MVRRDGRFCQFQRSRFSWRGDFLAAVCVLLVLFSGFDGACGTGFLSTGVLRLNHKFADKLKSNDSIKAFKDHDFRRHGRILSSTIDIPIGGTADPNVAGLYYAQLGIGSPVKQYYVQVDTGSDILWVNCVPCYKCPKKSGLGVKLTLYNPDDSSSSALIGCDQSFCYLANQGDTILGCKSGNQCQYSVQYGDGSSTTGYYVKDILQFNEVTGNFQTRTTNASVIFGCGAQQSGELQSSNQALDGILGFGQSNTSMLSQLALSGEVRKIFSHCLDGDKGGGILAIGDVVPVNLSTTPLVPNQPHYNVNLKRIDVDSATLPLDSKVFATSDKQGTIIDSGTTLAYLSEPAYQPLVNAIMLAERSLTYLSQDGMYCFAYDGSVDAAFPTITLYFEGALSMKVSPHDYLLSSSDNTWCIGWQNSGAQSQENKYMTILGDLVLKNKLVVYNLENQTIGWVDYNCSSSIKVKSENGAYESVGAHHLSHGIVLRIGRSPLILISLLTLILFKWKS